MLLEADACIFDYWDPDNLTTMDLGGSNQDVHKKDLPFLRAKINEEKTAEKNYQIEL